MGSLSKTWGGLRPSGLIEVNAYSHCFIQTPGLGGWVGIDLAGGEDSSMQKCCVSAGIFTWGVWGVGFPPYQACIKQCLCCLWPLLETTRFQFIFLLAMTLDIHFPNKIFNTVFCAGQFPIYCTILFYLPSGF